MHMPFQSLSLQGLSPEDRGNAALRLFLGRIDCKLWRLFPNDLRGQLDFGKIMPPDYELEIYAKKLKDAGLNVVVEQIPFERTHRVILNETWENIIKVLSSHLPLFFDQNKSSPAVQANKSASPAVVSSPPLLSSQLVPQNGANNNRGISVAPPAKKESSERKPLTKEEQRKLDQEREYQQANLAAQTFIGRPDCTLWSLFHNHYCQLEFKDPQPQYYELQSYAKRLKEAGLNAVLEELPRPTPPRVMIRNLREKIITALNKPNLPDVVLQNTLLSSVQHKPSATVLPVSQPPSRQNNALVPLASSALVQPEPVLPIKSNNNNGHQAKPAALAEVPAKHCKPYAEPKAPQPPAGNISPPNANAVDPQNLLKELEMLRAENAALLATMNKPENSIEVVDADKATIRSMLQYFFDKIPLYPDKAVELIKKITTHYKKVKNTLKENVKDIINFAFVGTNISDEDKSELCSDLCDIHNIANQSGKKLNLKGEYSQDEIAKMVYDISIEYILAQQTKNNAVKPAAVDAIEMGMSAVTLTLKRSGSPVHNSNNAAKVANTKNDKLSAVPQCASINPSSP